MFNTQKSSGNNRSMFVTARYKIILAMIILISAAGLIFTIPALEAVKDPIVYTVQDTKDKIISFFMDRNQSLDGLALRQKRMRAKAKFMALNTYEKTFVDLVVEGYYYLDCSLNELNKQGIKLVTSTRNLPIVLKDKSRKKVVEQLKKSIAAFNQAAQMENNSNNVFLVQLRKFTLPVGFDRATKMMKSLQKN